MLGGDGTELPHGETGALVAKLPMPPGSSPTLWLADERFRATYLDPFPGYYLTADAGYIDERGYVFVMARTDDIINVAGHRLSTGAIEEVLAAHPDVAECAVIGVADELKGQVPVGLLVLKADVQRPEEHIVREAVQLVRDRIGPVTSFKTAVIVGRLPKTRSGKILRGTMRRIADDHAVLDPANDRRPQDPGGNHRGLASSRLWPRLRQRRAEQLKLRRSPGALNRRWVDIRPYPRHPVAGSGNRREFDTASGAARFLDARHLTSSRPLMKMILMSVNVRLPGAFACLCRCSLQRHARAADPRAH